jgi:acyl-CoA thioester hydrolase
LLKARKDYSRWSIRHQILKNGDTVSAIVTVDGAWINTIQRKLTLPPPIAENVFSEMPLDENFQWM